MAGAWLLLLSLPVLPSTQSAPAAALSTSSGRARLDRLSSLTAFGLTLGQTCHLQMHSARVEHARCMAPCLLRAPSPLFMPHGQARIALVAVRAKKLKDTDTEYMDQSVARHVSLSEEDERKRSMP